MIASVRRWARRRRRGPLRAPALVLAYHRFSTAGPDPWALGVAPQHFVEHLSLLRRRYRVASLAGLVRDVAASAVQPGTVVITADDGYADDFLVAAPLLAQGDTPATFFVTTGGVDAPAGFWWDELAARLLTEGRLPPELVIPDGPGWTLGDAATLDGPSAARFGRWRATEPPPTPRHRLYLDLWRTLQPMAPAARAAALQGLRAAWGDAPGKTPAHRTMTSDELRALSSIAPIELGAHGCTHRPLDGLDARTLSDEIGQSRLALEEITERRVRAFAYPHGAHDEAARRAVANAGMACACTSAMGGVSSTTDPYAIPRLHIQDWSADDLEEHLFWWFGR